MGRRFASLPLDKEDGCHEADNDVDADEGYNFKEREPEPVSFNREGLLCLCLGVVLSGLTGLPQAGSPQSGQTKRTPLENLPER
jgi:hypothetical protein